MCSKYCSTMEIRDSSITCCGVLVYSIDTRTEFLLAATGNIIFIYKTYIFECGCLLFERNFDVFDVKEVNRNISYSVYAFISLGLLYIN